MTKLVIAMGIVVGGLAGAALAWSLFSNAAPPGTDSVGAAAVDHLVLSPSSSSITAGNSQTYTVTADDASNNALGTVTAQSTLSITPDGSCTGASCTATTAGPHTVTAHFWGTSGQASLTVNAATASKVVWVTQPGTSTAGSAVTGPPTVEVEDTYGNPVSGATVTISVSTGPGGFAGGSTTSVGPTSANGQAVFSNLVLDTAGTTYKVTASDGAINSPASSVFTVNASTPSKLTFTTQPSSGQNIQATGTGTFAVSVAVQDTYGNTEIGDNATTVTLSIGTNPSSGVVTCTNTGGLGPVTVAAGVANYTGCAITKAGTGYTLTASSNPSRTAPTNANAFNITAGAATNLTFIAQPTSGQSIQAAGTGTFTASVAVQDVNGNTEVGDNATTVTLAIGINPSGGVLTCTNTNGVGPVTVSGGVANYTGCAVTKAGNGYALTASSTPSHTAPANANSFNIIAGAPTKLSFTAQPTSGQSIQATGTATFAVSVAVQDVNGNTEVGDNATTVTLAINNNPSGGVLNCTNTGGLGPVTVVAGIANYTGCAITKAGIGYTLTASSSPLRTAPANANSFNITAGTASQLVYATQPTPGQNIQAKGTGSFSVTIQVQDANGNLVTTSSASVSLAITSGTGTAGAALSCTNSGGTTVNASGGVATFTGCAITLVGSNYTLTATSTGLASAVSNAFSITAGTASQFVVAAPASTPAGTAVTGITLTAKDANGNIVTNYGGGSPVTIAWSGASTSPAGNAPSYPTTSVSFTNGVSTTSLSGTLFAAGSNSLTASAASPTVTGSTSINVTALTASHLAWTSVSITKGTLTGVCYFSCTYSGTGNSAVFKAKVSLTDAYGNVVANTGSAFTVTVTASGGAFTGSATVTIPSGGTTSNGGGDGSVAGEITFTTQSGGWTTDSLSMTNTGGVANNASASLSK